MRISNSFLSNVPASSTRGTSPIGDSAASESAKADDAQSTHVPSPELVQLQQLLQQAPETRADRLAQVADSLASGYYLTSTAAERTAGAMLQSPE